MGHPGNWSPRKVESERRANEASDRARLREVTLYAHYAKGQTGRRYPNWFRLHPCATFRLTGLTVRARCMGCRVSWPIEAYMLDDTPWAHRYWPAVMQELACPACGSCPSEIRFADAGGDVGALSTRAEVTLHVYKDLGFRKPEDSRGAPDPFAQHDDGSP